MKFSRTLPKIILTLVSLGTTPASAASLFSEQWALKNTGQEVCDFQDADCTDGKAGDDIGYEAVMTQFTDCSQVVVAILDTGVDLNHPDLVGNILPGKNFVDGQGTDDVQDDNLHGTHVTGIVAGIGTPDSGIVGVCHKAKVLPVKVGNAQGELADSDILAGIAYAVAQGARVINGSFGGPDSNAVVEQAIAKASNTLFVFAAGNGDDQTGIGYSIDEQPEFPAAYDEPNIVTVAATDASDQLASFSNYGVQHVQLAAPGVNIVSTLPMQPTDEMDQYGIPTEAGPLDGTSMATPYVTGALTMLLSSNASLTAAQAKARLLASVDKVDALNGKVQSGGRLNLAKLMGVSR